MSETDLLTQFRENRSEAAFAALVRRYTNLVYSVAKRRLSDDLLAQDATQTVFIRLANAVPKLRTEAQLASWLHRTTVHVSIDLWRSETSRHAREERSISMQPDTTESTSWNEISPVLDDALNELNDGERQVILLRFFEQKSMRDLGAAFGIGEDAAKMRVSRAMERLREMFRARGVTCGVAVLGTLMTQHVVEAAPTGIVTALGALHAPVQAQGFAGAAFTKLPVAKLAVAGTTALVVAVATFWLMTAKQSKVIEPRLVGTTPNLSEGTGEAVGSTVAESELTKRVADPIKLLQDVANARNRITSGQVEYEVVQQDIETNVLRLQAVFDGNRRRFEYNRAEYSYTAADLKIVRADQARIRAEGMDKETAVKAGLLRPSESHYVTAFNGMLVLEYREKDGKPEQAKIDDDLAGSSAYLFDPRSVGLGTSMGSHVTVEGCVPNPEDDAAVVGEEEVNGVPAMHVTFTRGSMKTDYWLETANPTRVLKHTWNGSTVLSTYNTANPRDVIPIEVTIISHHLQADGQLGKMTQIIRRGNSQFGIPIDPQTWTLAGLGMKVGTDVIDYRYKRQIGTWTGTGLSADRFGRGGKTTEYPNRAELLFALEHQPASPAALEAAQWMLLNIPDCRDVEIAADVIQREHITNTNLVHLARELERMRHTCSTQLLEQLVLKNPSIEVRGNAAFTLATLHKEKAGHGTNAAATTAALKWFERVISEFGTVTMNGKSLAEQARPEFDELRQLRVGMPAPKTSGRNLEGQPMDLEAYRGKIVVLVFWEPCGGCRPDMEKVGEWLEKFASKPVAIVGVYCDDDADKGLKIARELEMTWPSFVDNESGPISKSWNNNSWPNFTIIDAAGTIRHRKIYDIYIAKAVEQLLAE